MIRHNKKKNFYGFILKSTMLFTLIILMQIGTNCFAAGPWTGTWETKWQDGSARMFLVQSGNQVTGTYEHRNGRIQGTVSGNTLKGQWYQDNGSGTIVFTIANDGKSFSGYYDNKQWWNGTKIAEKSLDWTGTWDTKWQGGGAKMHLVQSGNQVTGTYEHRKGKIKGTVSGNTLKGNWYQDNGSGTIVFTIANDGKSFSGYYDNKQWWNGKRMY